MNKEEGKGNWAMYIVYIYDDDDEFGDMQELKRKLGDGERTDQSRGN